MIIQQDVYEFFYDTIEEHFRVTEFVDLPNWKYLKQSRGLWTNFVEGEKTLRVFRIVGKFTNDCEIFYRLRTEARKNGYAKEKDELFIHVFKYMDVTLPLEIAGEEISEDIEAKIMLQFFLKKYDNKNNFLSIYPELAVFDETTGILRGSSNDPEVIIEKIVFKNIAAISNEHKSAKYIIYAVHRFYEYINDLNFSAAILLINDGVKDRASNYFQLRLGYIWSQEISSVHVWSVQEYVTSFKSEKSISCYVSFDEKIDKTAAAKHLLLKHRKDEYSFLGKLTQRFQTNGGLSTTRDETIEEKSYTLKIEEALLNRMKTENAIALDLNKDFDKLAVPFFFFGDKKEFVSRILNRSDKKLVTYNYRRFYIIIFDQVNNEWKISQIFPAQIC